MSAGQHAVAATAWDEPAGAASPRGWLISSGNPAGFYLDYGPAHYRSPHKFCRPGKLCPDCEPGSVLAVRYPAGPGTRCASRYCETVADAKAFVECGAAPASGPVAGGVS